MLEVWQRIDLSYGSAGKLALVEKSDKNRGGRYTEGVAEIALSYISQLFDNAGDTQPRGAR